MLQDDTIHCKKYDLCSLQGNIHRDFNRLQQDFQNKMLQTNYLLKVVTETNQTFACFIFLSCQHGLLLAVNYIHVFIRRPLYSLVVIIQHKAVMGWLLTSDGRYRFSDTLDTIGQNWDIDDIQYLLVLGLIPIHVRTVPVDGPCGVQLRLFCTNQWTIEPNLAGFQQWEFCQHR